MFYIAGDIHGLLEVDKVVKYVEYQSSLRKISKDDFLILLGDVGICWHGDQRDKALIDSLQSLPLTTLFIEGNHERFPLLNSYPISKWCGGRVHIIEEDIIHLMRGQVFNINGITFFTMGGAASQDKMYRTEGIDWFEEELPNEKEQEEGLKNLRRNNNNVDYILTHTCPYNISYKIRNNIADEEEDFLLYLQDIAENVRFKAWLFGHFHEVLKLGKFRCLYDRFIRIKDNEVDKESGTE